MVAWAYDNMRNWPTGLKIALFCLLLALGAYLYWLSVYENIGNETPKPIPEILLEA